MAIVVISTILIAMYETGLTETYYVDRDRWRHSRRNQRLYSTGKSEERVLQAGEPRDTVLNEDVSCM